LHKAKKEFKRIVSASDKKQEVENGDKINISRFTSPYINKKPDKANNILSKSTENIAKIYYSKDRDDKKKNISNEKDNLISGAFSDTNSEGYNSVIKKSKFKELSPNK